MSEQDPAQTIARLHTTAVDLSGVLKVLGDNLYSSPRVAIRELIQNAHDACVRRNLEDPKAEPAYITLTCDPEGRGLIVEDTGSGLTPQEIQDCLATIGAGYTAGLREAKPEADAIGYFGLGFLSVYAIAETVELETTSYSTPNETWRFKSSGGIQFSLTPAPCRPVGTRVRMRLKEDHTALSDPNHLRASVARHCALLPVPVYMAGESSPINDLDPPWRADPDIPDIRRRALCQGLAEHFDPSFSPICSWDLSLPDLGLNAVIWVQDGRSYARSDARSVSVFARGMFITDRCREMLPSWAGFMGCVVDARGLTPTASREDLRRDAVFDAVCDAVHNCVIEGICALPERQPEAWRRITRRHADTLRGAALADDRLFALLRDTLTVPTSFGEMTLTRLSQNSKGRILMKLDEANGPEAMLFKAQQLPVVLGFRYGAAPFARRYAQEHDMNLVELGTRQASADLFPPAEVPEQARDRLAAHLAKPGERLVTAHFEPDLVPFLFVTDEDARLKRRLEADREDSQIGSAALRLAQIHLKEVRAEITRDIVVNLSNPLIQRLTQADVLDDATQRALIAMRAYLLTLGVEIADDDIDPAAEMTAFFESMVLLAEGAP